MWLLGQAFYAGHNGISDPFLYKRAEFLMLYYLSFWEKKLSWDVWLLKCSIWNTSLLYWIYNALLSELLKKAEPARCGY